MVPDPEIFPQKSPEQPERLTQPEIQPPGRGSPEVFPQHSPEVNPPFETPTEPDTQPPGEIPPLHD
jgi:hypothetical protein